jgi:hypothetical protein
MRGKPEAPVETLLVVLLAYSLLGLLPFHTERRIGEHIVEYLMGVAVVGERVTRLDVRYILPLDEHVCFANGVGLVVQLLAGYGESRLRVVFMYPLTRDRKHSSRTGCWVVNGSDDSRLRENIVILGKDEVDHEPDNLTRCEVLAGSLVGEFRKLANQLLEDGSHVRVADLVRVKVNLAKLLGDEVEQVGVGEPIDLRLQFETGEDVFDVRRKAVEIRSKVHRDVILVANDGLQVHRRSVVEGVAGRPSQIVIDALPRDILLGSFLQNSLLR